MVDKRRDEIARFRELLEQKSLKFTLERKTILDEVMKQKAHFDADSFFSSLKRREQGISRDTVYRTLPLLLESGILQKSVGDGRREYYERTSRKGHHDHMICIDCGKVIEFKNEQIESIQDQIAREHGFRMVFHDHRLFGHCKGCSSRRA